MGKDRLTRISQIGLPTSVIVGLLAIILYFFQGDPAQPPWFAGLTLLAILLVFLFYNGITNSTFFSFERLMVAYIVIGVIMGAVAPLYFGNPQHWTAAMRFYGAFIGLGALALLIYHYAGGGWLSNIGPAVWGAAMALVTDSLRRYNAGISDWFILQLLFLVFLAICLTYLVYLVFQFRARSGEQSPPG
jgi:chromate transport protein ChrA